MFIPTKLQPVLSFHNGRSVETREVAVEYFRQQELRTDRSKIYQINCTKTHFDFKGNTIVKS